MRADVLIYGMNFSPELTGVGRYSGELARGLADKGLKVEVITTSPHYPGWFVRPPYSAWRYHRETVNGVRVIRCPMALRHAGRGVWRLIAPLTFALASAPVAAWRILRSRPRAVLCVEPTLLAAPLALVMARLVGARTALHVQDLEVDAAFAVGHLSGGGLTARIAHAFERAVLKRFQAVVTISHAMARALEEKGVERRRVQVVRNWVDTSRIRPLAGSNGYRAELALAGGDSVVLYAGQIGAKQALHRVFEAAERLKDRPGVVFVIAGEGPLKARFAARYGKLPNLRLLDLQPEARLNELLNLADCHILPQDPAVRDLVLPSKLGGMLASGRPILVVADDDSELALFLGRSCVRLPPDRIAQLDATLLDMIERRVGTDATSRRARLALAKKLNFRVAVDAFADILTPAQHVASAPQTSSALQLGAVEPARQRGKRGLSSAAALRSKP